MLAIIIGIFAILVIAFVYQRKMKKKSIEAEVDLTKNPVGVITPEQSVKPLQKAPVVKETKPEPVPDPVVEIAPEPVAEVKPAPAKPKAKTSGRPKKKK
jgi:hypothetical protein